MRDLIDSLIKEALIQAQSSGVLAQFEVTDTGLERPGDPKNGDWTSTLALKCAKLAKQNPRTIAEAVVDHMPQHEAIASVEIAGPGFINFTLSQAAHMDVITQIRTRKGDFGRSDAGSGQRVQVEFVSANPVGPMHVGHGRWAALGDSLCRVLEHAGWDVQREFYINDAGSQMDVFAKSISERYMQICKLATFHGLKPQEAADLLEADRENFVADEGEHPYHDEFLAACEENSYGGEYIIRIAQHFYEEYPHQYANMEPHERELILRERGYELMMEEIRSTLEKAGVNFDVYFSERTLHAADADDKTDITRAFDKLKAAGCLYEQDGALWFRSTDFGDDKDRVLVKSDGSYTYFAADIAYHSNKFDRGFDKVINIWGADHHGYVPRMMAACTALGYPGQLEILLGQLVNLLRDGEPMRMSKRKGTMITFEELLNEVGVDATRYNLLCRSSDQEIDFDIELAKRKSADNPVYYVQYAHARICSLLRKAAQAGAGDGVETEDIDTVFIDNLACSLAPLDTDLSKLVDPSERELARLASTFEDLIAHAARDRAPFRLTHYAQELAAAFHQFYTRCHVLTDDPELTQARIALCDAIRQLLALTLQLIGVSAPVRM